MSLCESLLLCPAPIVTRCLEGTRCRKAKGTVFGFDMVSLGQSLLTRFRYAMLLNGLLAAFFIVAGSFNGLVVLIGMFPGDNPVRTADWLG